MGRGGIVDVDNDYNNYSNNINDNNTTDMYNKGNNNVTEGQSGSAYPVDVLDVRVGSDEEFPMDIIEDSPVRRPPRIETEKISFEYKVTTFLPPSQESNSLPFPSGCSKTPPAIPSLLSCST